MTKRFTKLLSGVLATTMLLSALSVLDVSLFASASEMQESDYKYVLPDETVQYKTQDLTDETFWNDYMSKVSFQKDAAVAPATVSVVDGTEYGKNGNVVKLATSDPAYSYPMVFNNPSGEYSPLSADGSIYLNDRWYQGIYYASGSSIVLGYRKVNKSITVTDSETNEESTENVECYEYNGINYLPRIAEYSINDTEGNQHTYKGLSFVVTHFYATVKASDFTLVEKTYYDSFNNSTYFIPAKLGYVPKNSAYKVIDSVSALTDEQAAALSSVSSLTEEDKWADYSIIWSDVSVNGKTYKSPQITFKHKVNGVSFQNTFRDSGLYGQQYRYTFSAFGIANNSAGGDKYPVMIADSEMTFDIQSAFPSAAEKFNNYFDNRLSEATESEQLESLLTDYNTAYNSLDSRVREYVDYDAFVKKVDSAKNVENQKTADEFVESYKTQLAKKTTYSEVNELLVAYTASKENLSESVKLLINDSVLLKQFRNKLAKLGEPTEIQQFNFDGIDTQEELDEELTNRIKSLDSTNTFSLNGDGTVTYKKNAHATGGFVFENEADTTVEPQKLEGTVYLGGEQDSGRGGTAFIFSKNQTDTAYNAAMFALKIDSVGGLTIIKNYGTVYSTGANGEWGGWNPAYYVSNSSVKTATTVKSLTQCRSDDTYSTTKAYYKKENGNFVFCPKNTIGNDTFAVDPTAYYTYTETTTNQFNLANVPDDCTDVLSETDGVYTLTTIKSTQGYFVSNGASAMSLSDYGLTAEEAESIRDITSIDSDDRMIEYSLYYKGESKYSPIISFNITVADKRISLQNIPVVFYSSTIKETNKKALGLGHIYSWYNSNSSTVKFGNTKVTYSINNADRTYDISEQSRSIRKIGRAYYDESGNYTMGWQSSGVEFKFKGTGATVTLNASDVSSVAVWVDGVRQVNKYENYRPSYAQPNYNLYVAKGTNDYIICSDSENKEHTVRIEKLTFGGRSKLILEKIYLHTGGIILDAPSASEKTIVAIGDSITEGMGVVPGNGDLNTNEDPAYNYAGFAAEAFGAEVADNIGVGGIGISCNSAGEDFNILDVYDSVDYYNAKDSAGKVDFTRFNTDAVVINLGTNDSAYWKKLKSDEIDYDNFIKMFKNMINQIRSYYPEKPIFYLYGMMDIGNLAKTPIEQAINEMTADGFTGLYYVSVPACEGDKKGYADHPNIYGHKEASKYLIAKMAEVLNWETADMQNNLAVTDIDDVEYDEISATPKLTVTLNGKELTENTDYMVTYQNNDGIGTATAIVMLIGDYSGVVKKDFNIVAKRLKGFVEKDGKTYYYENGEMVKGFKEIDGKTYYFKQDTGVMYKNTLALIGGKLYSFDKDGSLNTNDSHYKIEDDKCYFDGIQVTGWQTIDGNKYYFSPKTGKMTKNYVGLVADTVGSFDENGIYTADENLTIKGQKCYAVTDTTYSNPLTGWQTIYGKQFYFRKTGAYAGNIIVDATKETSKALIGGQIYTFTKAGYLLGE